MLNVYGDDICASAPWPDAGGGACCIGAAVYGPERCTCWEPVYDLEQQPQVPGLLSTAQPTQCHDCAYRPGSPERNGDEGYKGDQEALDDYVVRGAPFWCHQGMRHVVKWVHPSGMEVPGHPAAYKPPVVIEQAVAGDDSTRRPLALKADGTPADLCAGWVARRLAYMQRDVVPEAVA